VNIPRSIAVIRAIDAIHRTLAQHLPAVLQEYEQDEPGLRLPPPDRYHQALSSQSVEDALTNANVAVFIFQASESITGIKSSLDALNQAQQQSTFIEVRVAYQHYLTMPYTPPTWASQLTSQDILARRGYYYVGGIMDVIYRKLCCESNGAVSDVLDVDSDFAGAIFLSNNQQYHGMASIVFELRQDVSIPYCE
jgi:hypothetical protein